MKVLVVDDDPEVAAALAEQARLLNHEVTAVTDGEQAIAAAQRVHFEAALLDLAMPVMDGYELARRLIVMRPSGLYLVAVTGSDSDADLLRTATAGFVEHLVKPCPMAVLRGALERAALRNAGSRPAPSVL
ncbi:MAG: response regulator [Lautropia sp.]